MKEFQTFFLMQPEDVKRYTVEVLHYFQPGDDIQCAEIGDGNINYVTKAWNPADGRSIIVKQADQRLRSSGRPLDIYRSKIEAQVLALESKLAPAYIPHVFRYDETMAALSMEDISAYKNLRKELMENRVYPHLGENLSSFLADVLLPTTDLVLGGPEKKAQVKFFINPELCEITEDLVLTEPYDDYKGRNIITPGNEDFVQKFLYEDEDLKAEVAALRCNFMNNAQALIHGDLHSGSIFANQQGVKIIDPEFAFYGPMGYDIGNVIGNLFFSWANKAYTMPAETAAMAGLENTIAALFDLTGEKLGRKYDELVVFPLYRTKNFRKNYLDGVMADALGYAGTEIIRRVVGDSKVLEVSSVTDLNLRVPMERALIHLGIALIQNRRDISSGRALTETFQQILKEGGR
ncbi:MAG: S-methyl-5-thioribose kinase [Oscillibacter sp.]